MGTISKHLYSNDTDVDGLQNTENEVLTEVPKLMVLTMLTLYLA